MNPPNQLATQLMIESQCIRSRLTMIAPKSLEDLIIFWGISAMCNSIDMITAQIFAEQLKDVE